MSDNLRRYRAIKQELRQLYPGQLTARQAQHLETLSGMISGIVGSRKVQLPAMASKIPGGKRKAKRESRTKRFSRWLKNEAIDGDTYFMPFAKALLEGLAQSTVVLAIDGSEAGRGCVCLMVSVLYKGRALPLAWLVVAGKKGHFPENHHIEVLKQVKLLVSDGTDVIVLGDGEFDGVKWQAQIAEYGWCYVCRTAKNTLVCEEGVWFKLVEWGVTPGQCLNIPNVQFTQQAYGPVRVIAWWDAVHEEPIYLVTNMDLAEEACHWYQKRAHIETFFSDQKSRGFHLQKSHISDPARLARLLIAACLAYIWMIYLGVIAKRNRWVSVIHRTDRCDLSLFQLGLELLEHFLNEEIAIPVAFRIPLWSES
jgi:hypothetical protein